MPITLPSNTPWSDLDYDLTTTDGGRLSAHRREPEFDDSGRMAFQTFTVFTGSNPMALEFQATDFLSLSAHHKRVLLDFFTLRLTGERIGHTRAVPTTWNYGRGSTSPERAVEMIQRDMHPDVFLMATTRPGRIIPTLILRAMNEIDRREREGRDRPTFTPASPWTPAPTVAEAVADIEATVEEVEARPRIPEGATVHRASLSVTRPEPLVRIIDEEKYRTRFNRNTGNYTAAAASRAGLTTAIYSTTADGPSLKQSRQRTARGIGNWLKAYTGLDVHESVIHAVVTVVSGHAATIIQQANDERDRHKASATAYRRELQEARQRIRELEAVPAAPPEAVTKAARWDEAHEVARAWNEAPATDARGKLNAFRRLHDLLSNMADTPAPPAAE